MRLATDPAPAVEDGRRPETRERMDQANGLFVPPRSRRGFLIGATAAGLATLLPTGRPSWAGSRRRDGYFPPPESAGGWRALVGPDLEPAAGEKADIRRLAGVDWDRLLEAYLYSRGLSADTSLLVIRNGWVAGEWGPRNPFYLASVSKSLTGLAALRLVHLSRDMRFGRKLKLAEPVYPFLPPAWSAAQPAKRLIRLEHLLTMTSGLEPDDQPIGSGYTVETVLSKPVAAPAGAQWAYCSAAVDLLGIALQRATRRSLGDFFDAEIGAAIGMAPITWRPLEDDVSQACCSAVHPARELARVGYLVLRGGRWGDPTGERILLGKKEIKALTRPAKAAAKARFAPTPNSPFPVDPDAPSYYGTLWWTNATGRALGPAVPRDAVYAHGYRETLLVVVPSLDLVVVRFGSRPEVLPELRRELMSRVMAAIV